MNTSRKIIFFGTEQFSLVALNGLIEAGYEVAAVVTKPDSKKGRGQELSWPEVKKLAVRHQIPVWQPQNLANVTEDIKDLQPATGILVSYGKIIPQSTIDLFTPGIINVHPSLLPKYRGPSPIESVITNGDKTTGISIMRLSAKMDAGPIYIQETVALTNHETRPELYKQLAIIGTKLLLESLPRVLDGSLQPTSQPDDQATYCQLLQKADGLLEPTKLTAVEAERRVRAYVDFPKTRLTIGGEARIITKAHVSQSAKTPLDVVFRDKKFLSIDELIAPSGKTVSTAEFLRGYAA